MKKCLYKIFMILVITITLNMLIITSTVQASKIGDSQFYYTGTTKGSYSVTKSLGEWLINLLAEIVDYILGLMTMGVRMVFIGWTVVFENLLTFLLKSTTGEEAIDMETTSISTNSREVVTVESIIFNRVPILDINIFKYDYNKEYTGTGHPIESDEEVQ